MPQTLPRKRWHLGERATHLPFSAIEILVLAPLAGVLVLGVIPAAFDIEWSCVGSYGAVSTRGDSYLEALAVAGTFGWILVLVGVLFAQIAERPRLAAILPLAWFTVLVFSALLAAATVGPSLCPS